MEICDLLSAESVISNIRVTSKKQLLQEVSLCAANICGKNERTIFDILIERERLGTTGIGRGVAIPHGKLPELDHLYGVFVKLEQPIDFESMDDEAVDLIFLLLENWNYQNQLSLVLPQAELKSAFSLIIHMYYL